MVASCSTSRQRRSPERRLGRIDVIEMWVRRWFAWRSAAFSILPRSRGLRDDAWRLRWLSARRPRPFYYWSWRTM